MIDKIASLTAEDNSDLLGLLDEFCATKQHGESVRYSEFVAECTKRGISLSEDSWYDLMEESRMYTFAEDCDVDGVYWTIGHVVL